jgi:hypothetical protein
VLDYQHIRVEVDILRVATCGNYTAHMDSIQAFSRAEFLRLIASAESRPVLRKTGSPRFSAWPAGRPRSFRRTPWGA